ncbi:CYTH and CHAD domain-containing protein [Thauera sinica]|uniref:CHAD domain-containing protein n=1 Tax=Thauera sinica TaxID=2665146 RepID=A0ABW1ALE2_9RHOO|nr:CHAD domain-containing protein [Thauera sp. K11]ATE60829.1 inorganic triphosphatase [Thauera sp. K11]
MSQEIELKLTLPPRAVAALRRHPLVAAAPRLGPVQTLHNTYYDTPSLDLKAHKVAVRTRQLGRNRLQTVKCAAVSGGGLSQRPEWEQPYGGTFDFSQVDAPATARLLARHAAALEPVFTTRFRRETRRHEPRTGVSILLMIDTGSIEVATPDGEKRTDLISELELELEHGAPADLLELACELARDLPLMPADASKAERGYRLFLQQPATLARAEPSTISADQDVVEAFRTLALSCLRQWQANASAAAHSHDPDFIHQLRVSQRRLRSLLKAFAPALPVEFVGEWNVRLRENTNRFGDARDLDVLHMELIDPVQPEGLPDAEGMARLLRLAADARTAARRNAERNLDPAAQGRLMLEFTAALLRLPTGPLAAAADLRTFARLRLARLRKRGRRQFDAAAGLVPVRLHALRISFKELRYGIEFFAPLFPAKATTRYIAALTRAQDTLGFLQDVDIAHGRLAAWAGENGGLRAAAAFILGWHGPRYARLRRRVLHDCEPLLWGKTPW